MAAAAPTRPAKVRLGLEDVEALRYRAQRLGGTEDGAYLEALADRVERKLRRRPPVVLTASVNEQKALDRHFPAWS